MSARQIWTDRELEDIERSFSLADYMQQPPLLHFPPDNQPGFSTDTIITANEFARLCKALRCDDVESVARSPSDVAISELPFGDQDRFQNAYTFNIDQQRRPRFSPRTWWAPSSINHVSVSGDHSAADCKEDISTSFKLLQWEYEKRFYQNESCAAQTLSKMLRFPRTTRQALRSAPRTY